jgi:branched-chain amino acid transport system substrate-binding protein
MKKHAIFAAMALTALIAVGCGSSSSSSSTSSAAASSSTTAVASSGSASGKCATSIAIMAPLTGPDAQLGLEQLHFAQLAVATDNAANKTNVTLNQDDTQLTPSIAVTKTQAIIASPAVAVIGPAGSQEVEAVGPLFGKVPMAFVSGSASGTALATSGMNPTFFRVVAADSVQGPQDANYIIHHLHPKAVLIVDDDEAYSQGLVKVMTPILTKAGIKVNHQTYNGTDTGATLANALSSLVTSQLNPSETVTVLPWQTAANAQQFGLDAQQQHKTTTLFGTDGTDSPSQFKIPGTYVSNIGPDIANSTSALDKGLVAGVAKYGPYAAFGVPTYTATDVEMKAIASVCKAGQTPSRSNVLAAIKKTNIPASENPLGIPIKFASNGNLIGSSDFLFHINGKGVYVSIPSQ